MLFFWNHILIFTINYSVLVSFLAELFANRACSAVQHSTHPVVVYGLDVENMSPRANVRHDSSDNVPATRIGN